MDTIMTMNELKMKTLNKNQKAFVLEAQKTFGEDAIVSRDQLQDYVDKNNIKFPFWLVNNSSYRCDRGLYRLPTVNSSPGVAKTLPDVAVQPTTLNLSAQVLTLRQPKLLDENDPSIPEVDKTHVPFGFYRDLKNIIKTGLFYPVYIVGHSGNGKTQMVEQVCAELNREMIRVNFSIETDESDLLGGPTLINGNVVHKDGPIVTAMKRGAVMLLDECLEENEKVRIGTVDNWKSISLKDLEFDVEYPVVSFNMESGNFENDVGSLISEKEDDLYEVEFEDGRTIKLNSKHPFIINSNGTFVQKSIEDGLNVGDYVVSVD